MTRVGSCTVDIAHGADGAAPARVPGLGCRRASPDLATCLPRSRGEGVPLVPENVLGEGLVIVTVQVSVRACTVGELAAAATELSWTPVRTVDEQLDEPGELSATTLGELDDTTFLRLRAALPREPGLYLWTAAPDGAWSGHTSDRAVIYLGRATGAGGLRARLGDELRWVRNGVGHTASYRQANYHGHPRTMIMHDARALHAVTDDREQAAELERELLAVASYGCALSPLANGGSWWSSTTHQRRARQRGYDRLAAAGLLIDPSS